MPIDIRYVQNPSFGGGIAVTSKGWDHQLVAFEITTVAGIAEGEAADILTWTGVGKIRSWPFVFIRRPDTGEVIPLGAVEEETHTLLRVWAGQKTINLAVPDDGIPIPPGSTISLVLVIGIHNDTSR